MLNFDQIFPLNNLVKKELSGATLEEATLLGNLGFQELSRKRKSPFMDSEGTCGNPTEVPASTKRQKGDADKKRHRRVAAEIEREFVCFAEGCSKAYGTEGALKMHLRLKHAELPIPSRDELYMRCQAAKAAFQDLQSGVGLPWTVTAEKLMALTPLGDSKTTPDYYTVSLQTVKLGAWQKSSKNSWNIVASFSFIEQKFVWKFSSEKLLLKIEIPFSSVEGMAIERLPDGSTAFGLGVRERPSFSRLIVAEGFNKPSMWAPCTDFTGGCALSAKLHCLLFAKDRFPPALHSHLLRDPITKALIQRTLPITEQPEFLFFTLESCSSGSPSEVLSSSSGDTSRSNSPDVCSSSQSPLISPSSGLSPSSSSLSPFDGSCADSPKKACDITCNSSHNDHATEISNFSECSLAHRNSLLSVPLTKTIALRCCHDAPALKQLLSPYTCSCGFVYTYSFCVQGVVRMDNWVHCTECNQCTKIENEHCLACGSCVQELCVQCVKWESIVQEMDFPF